MNDIPIGFRRSKLGDEIRLQRGYDLPERQRVPGDVPIVTSSGVTGTHNVAMAKGPGVVTGRYGTLGEVYYVNEDFWPHNTALFVSNFKGNDPRFVAYFLKTLRLGTQNAAGAVPGVNRNVLHAMDVLFPEPNTQHRIAAILSAYDDLIENNRRRMALLEEAMHLLYRRWFVHLRFPGHEQTPIRDGVPEGWRRSTVRDSFSILGGGTPSRNVPAYWVDGTIQWFTPSDLTKTGQMFMDGSSEQITEAGLSESSARLFSPYSVMMTSRATIGAIAINTTEATTNQGFITCIPNPKVPMYFLYWWLKSNVETFNSLATGTTFKEISKSVFQRVQIVVPSQSVLSQFEKTVRPIADQYLNLQRQNRCLRAARDLLLPRLMNGSIPL